MAAYKGREYLKNYLALKRAEYELCIPKGDTHIWENRTVEFFGKKWRTFGIPQEWIRNAAESLFNALKDLAKKALQAAKDVLGIESPSKVFRDQVGRYIPAGVALGIRNNLGQVKAAVRQMSATATDNFAATLQMDTQESKRASGGGVSSGHGITVNQYIYSKSQTAADLMQEARYQAEMAVMLGV